MINIHHRLAELSFATSLNHMGGVKGREIREDRKMGTQEPAFGSDFSFRRSRSYPGGGLYERLDHVRLVLQLHDELIYEVRDEDLDAVSLYRNGLNSLPFLLLGCPKLSSFPFFYMPFFQSIIVSLLIALFFGTYLSYLALLYLII